MRSESNPRNTFPIRELVAVAGLEPWPDRPGEIASLLVVALHYSIDWDRSWVKDHLPRYWTTLLPERVRLAATRGQRDGLTGWWQLVCEDLVASPRTHAERREIHQLLCDHEPKAVLKVLREQGHFLVLRTRIVSQEVRQVREARTREVDAAQTGELVWEG